MLIHFQIPRSPDLQIKEAVPGKGGKHVGHKTNGVVQPGFAPAVKVKTYKNICFPGSPFNFSGPRHAVSSVFIAHFLPFGFYQS
jgi:hypothetical protein